MRNSTEINQQLRNHILNWFNLKFPQNNELAEDLTQEVLIRLNKNQSNVNENLKSYVKGIMLHVFSDYLRGSYRKPHPVSLDELFSLQDDTVKSPFSLELSEAMLEGIDKLPKKSIKIIMLKFQKGFTSKEIAAILGMKESAVKMQIKRAVEKLGTILKKSDFYKAG